MDTLGGGWTVIQNRFDGSQDFFQLWEGYKQGFGSPYGEYWIGNENLYWLTSSDSYELRIEMEDATGVTRFASYSTFALSSESNNYELTVSGYVGSTYNALAIHNNKPFSTVDQDNDESGANCALNNEAAWWYTHCHQANLNAPYRPSLTADSRAMSWYEFEQNGQGFATLRISKMMIRC
ncbi:ficolin-2-like [Argopecten irradians]|uniref:ficolin-2-like n=1 Tax=Argopecten irradians TaxID=31199 RepID=UPI003718087D